MKVIQKYFLAVIPPAEILDRAHQIKVKIRDQFGVKYALKSPPHITLKMPFNYNEAKETNLEVKLRDFLKDQPSFRLNIEGSGKFGNRVIFLEVRKSTELLEFQSSLKSFCKKELNLVDELSDRNYHPHLTVAFKDVKPSQFAEVYDLVKENTFDAEFSVRELVILKRMDRKWELFQKVSFGGGF